MKTGINGLNLLKRSESCKLSAYLDSVKVPTIGWGNTYYEDGSKVKLGDIITQERADALLVHLLPKYENSVSVLVKKPINQNQFDALVDFAYNEGAGNLQSSKLLKKININPNDPTIAQEFAKWDETGHKVLNGLIIRRKAESDLYFKPVV